MSIKAKHDYSITVTWTGNRGDGTKTYRAFARDHEIADGGKLVIPGSADPAFLGNPERYNPEQLLLSSLSACHMLWYLHLCANAGVTVTEYTDKPTGIMVENTDGGGHFEQVTLRPHIKIDAADDRQQAAALHAKAHALCFIANSVNFPITCEPDFDGE